MIRLPLLTELTPSDAGSVGPKAASLGALIVAGLDVPAGFVIPSEAVRELGPAVADWPPEAQAAIRARLDQVAGDGQPVAVRSSALDEDSASASFAGQHETILNVDGFRNLSDAIQRCLDSLHSAAAVSYRARAGGDQAAAAMAVVVQRMVDPLVAGVAFSIDPVTGDPTRMVIEAVAGLGDALVSGQAEADRHVLTRESLAVVEAHGGEGILTAQLSRDIAAAVVRAELHFGAPQDIEFAHDGSRLWLLQSRPITVMPSQLPGGGWMSEFDSVSGPNDLWTSANVQEVLPGLLTPLSITAYTEGGDEAYIEGYRRLGLVSRDESPQFAAYFYNRAFLNVNAIRQIAERSLGSNGDTLEHRYLGGPHNPKARGQRSLSLYRWRIRSLWPLIKLALMAKRRAGRAERAIQRMEARIRSDIPEKMSDTMVEARRGELARLSAEVLLLHLNVSGLAGAGFDLISRILTPTWRDETEGQMPALFSGMLGVESAQIGLDMWKLSRIAQAESMSDQLRQPEFDPAAQDLPRAWRAAWTGFIARHGHRGLAEMEASAVTWRYDPAPAVAVIRSYLDLPESRSPEATLKRQERERVELTTEVAAKMWQPKRLFFRRALSGAQENVALRERTKSLAVRAIRLVDIYRETIQERLVSRGFIASADDMYFLANSEITQVLLGTAPGPFQDRVIRRRKEYERNRHVRLPDRFTGHPVPLPDEVDEGTASVLRGTPVSPGSVTGRAHVILDPTVDSPLQPGEILVAPVTDAGWTPLFAIASGLVVDMGSALSHGSTVAREYGLPAVVNVRNATRIIKSGDLIAVNGTRGTVTIMETAAEKPPLPEGED